MLLAINWRYWQAGKSHACVWRFKVASGKRASLKSIRFSQKKSDTFLTEQYVPKVCSSILKHPVHATGLFLCTQWTQDCMGSDLKVPVRHGDLLTWVTHFLYTSTCVHSITLGLLQWTPQRLNLSQEEMFRRVLSVRAEKCEGASVWPDTTPGCNCHPQGRILMTYHLSFLVR